MKRIKKLSAVLLTLVMIIGLLPAKIANAASALSATLTMSVSSSTVGGTVKLTAGATGGSGSYTYQFVMLGANGGSSVILKSYSTSKEYTGAFTSTGTKMFAVYVKDSTGSVAVSDVKTVTVAASSTLSAALTVNGNTGTVNLSKGESVKLVPKAVGGSGSYTYQYVMKNASTGSTLVLKNYSSAASYTGPLTSTGTKIFTVNVKDGTGKVVASNSVTVVVGGSQTSLSASLKVNGATGTVNLSKGSNVTLVPTAAGGSGSYTYQYVMKNAATGSTLVLKNYSSATSYTGPLTTPGTKIFMVNVKDSAGKVVASNSVTVVVKAALSASLKVNGATGTLKLETGSNVTLVPAVTGGSGSYTYQYVMKNAATGSTVVLKGYSSATSYTGPLTTAGTKIFTVKAKDSTGTVVASNSVTVVVSNATVSVTGVSLNKTSVTLTEGETMTLTATVSPTNATNKAVSWSSSNTSVATVDSTGKVTAKAEGTATITVKTSDGSKKATCAVTVKAKSVAVTGIGINKAKVYLEAGKSETLTATVSPSNATNKSVTWSSNNTGVATVDSNGKVTAKSRGVATITAKTNDGSKAVNATIYVYSIFDGNDGNFQYGGFWFKIMSCKDTNYVLDVNNMGNTNGTKVQLYSWNNSDAQLWQALGLNQGLKIVPRCATNKALDVNRGGNSYSDPLVSGCKVDLWDTGVDDEAMTWQIIGLWEGRMAFKLRGYDLVLTAQTLESGSQIIVKPFDPSNELQQWKVEKAEPLANESVKQKIVSIAQAEVGNKENDPIICWTKYTQWYLDQEGKYCSPSYVPTEYEAWCAMFVSWVQNQAGDTTVSRFCSCTDGINKYTQKGRWRNVGYVPDPGDIVFFCNSGGAITHVAIVESVSNGMVNTIEGNFLYDGVYQVKRWSYNCSTGYGGIENRIMGYGLTN